LADDTSAVAVARLARARAVPARRDRSWPGLVPGCRPPPGHRGCGAWCPSEVRPQ